MSNIIAVCNLTSSLTEHVHLDASQLQNTDLRITEIFYSLQGEANTAGWSTVFVRLTGCPLRCSYCDTAYAFNGGHKQSIKAVLDTVNSFKARHVCVTGGEPLAQKACLNLLKALCDLNYKVSLETSGAIDISEVDTRVSRVMDLKTPSSDESDKNLLTNIPHLTQHDQIKFVISNREDYEWSKKMIDQFDLVAKVSTVWFSPTLYDNAVEELNYLPKQLAEWILEDHLPVRFQLQLHKLLWKDAKGK